MANEKISELTQLTAAANADLLPIVDDSASETKHITLEDLIESVILQGGITQRNLITNPFEVWSNSTLENYGSAIIDDDCADDDTADWSKWSGTTLTFDTDHYEIATTNTNLGIYFENVSFTKGKQYKISFDVKDGTASGIEFDLRFNDGVGLDGTTKTTTGSFVTHTRVFSPDTTASGWIGIVVHDNLSGNNIEIKNITLYEVTPGCIAADALACDGWAKQQTTLDIWRQPNDATYTKAGEYYALKATKGADSVEQVYWPKASSNLAHVAKFAGKTVTLGAWVYSVSAADNIKLMNYNTVDGWQYSTSFAGADAWEWLEYTVTIPAAATDIRFGFAFHGDTSDVAYISQPILVFGSSIGEGNYSRPNEKVISLEAPFYLTDYNGNAKSDQSNIEIDMAAQSNGKLPIGLKGVDIKTYTGDSGSSTSNCYAYMGKDVSDFQEFNSNIGTSGLKLDNDDYDFQRAKIYCNNDGNFEITIEASGSDTFDIGIGIYAVELR